MFLKKLKGLFKSKQVWLNILGVAIQVLNIENQWIPPTAAVYIQGILNVIVRWITKKPLEDK